MSTLILNPSLTVNEINFILQSISRYCGPRAASSLQDSFIRGFITHEDVLLTTARTCPPTSFIPIAGREVWPAAADITVFESDIESPSADQVVQKKMKTCEVLSTNRSLNRACVVFLHTETLQGAAGEVLRTLLNNDKMKMVLISSSNGDRCVPWWSVRSDGSVIEFPALRTLLDHERMLTWFTENPCMDHPKLRALPLGPKFRASTHFFLVKTYEIV